MKWLLSGLYYYSVDQHICNNQQNNIKSNEQLFSEHQISSFVKSSQ